MLPGTFAYVSAGNAGKTLLVSAHLKVLQLILFSFLVASEGLIAEASARLGISQEECQQRLFLL